MVADAGWALNAIASLEAFRAAEAAGPGEYCDDAAHGGVHAADGGGISGANAGRSMPGRRNRGDGLGEVGCGAGGGGGGMQLG